MAETIPHRGYDTRKDDFPRRLRRLFGRCRSSAVSPQGPHPRTRSAGAPNRRFLMSAHIFGVEPGQQERFGKDGVPEVLQVQ